jgi:hypothetical protein
VSQAYPVAVLVLLVLVVRLAAVERLPRAGGPS